MPPQDHDRAGEEVEEHPKEERPKEKRRGSKSGDKDGEHRHRHKSSRSSKTRLTDSDVQSSSHRRHRTKDEKEGAESPSTLDILPEFNISRDRVSLPYPTFSKAHSKEAVHSKEDVSSRPRRTDPLTPEATDLGSADIKRSKSADFSSDRKRPSSRKTSRKVERPPSPPETSLSGQKERRAGTPASARSREVEVDEERPRSRSSWLSKSTATRGTKSKLSTKSKSSSQATYVMTPAIRMSTADPSAAEHKTERNVSGETAKPDPIDVDLSPESAQDSSPKTPTQTPQFPPPPPGFPDDKQAPHHEYPPQTQTPATDMTAPHPPPPPPPPPPLNIQEAPRVDYLMQNGGLSHAVPKNFLAVLPRQNGTRPSNPPLRGPQTLFAPFFNLLDQYETVLANQGSIAVATGHRTVARRLLDRLENVFSRDLPPEGCSCVVCDRSAEPHRGLGWGEVLEKVSGRADVPPWPPFDLASLGHRAAEAADVPKRPASPVKMDPDISEEFRDHYLRQSKKVRASVDKWMSACAESPAPPPTEIDDETLAFAILTSLELEEKPYFNALLSGSREVQPTVRAPTPGRRPRQEFVVRTGLSLQRLYGLATAPRDAEAVLYLIKHQHLHDLLHTMYEINPSEWEILTSGRFDGFLWSGADDDEVTTPTAEAPSRGATPASGFFPPHHRGARAMSPGGLARAFSPAAGSRNTTPFSAAFSRATTPAFSRGPTPASFVSGTSMASRQAVSNDEEAEVAVLAEIEREIYVGMEALEDAFETLHQKAELVRGALRQRGAGLSMSLQHRRGLGGAGIDVLPQSGGSGANERPSWGAADDESMASESDWGGDEFDIAPEDSASNISSSRHRRPKRRNERRTPAPIEEEGSEV